MLTFAQVWPTFTSQCTDLVYYLDFLPLLDLVFLLTLEAECFAGRAFDLLYEGDFALFDWLALMFLDLILLLFSLVESLFDECFLGMAIDLV